MVTFSTMVCYVVNVPVTHYKVFKFMESNVVNKGLKLMWIVVYSVDYFPIPTNNREILDNIKGALLNLFQSKVIIFFTGSLGGGCIIGIIFGSPS